MAQIVPDSTLPVDSIVTPQGNNSLITGGTITGGNLFHSFSEFSIPTNHSAFFNNSTGIVNIITRVTGSSISNIDGLIKTNDTANLFLLNANGIIFGRHAQLNIGGSFFASSASAIKFADGTMYSTTPNQNTPLLTMSVPIGLQFGEAPGTIQNQSQATDNTGRVVGLSVKPEKTIGLIGGDIIVPGGYITAPKGRVELGSVASAVVVNLTPTDKGYALGYEGIERFQDINLLQGAAIDGSGESGADIQIYGKRVAINNGSLIRSRTLGATAGGKVVVSASESVEMQGTTGLGLVPSLLSAATSGSGAAGNITITTKRLRLQDGAQIIANSLGSGRGGNLSIQASESVEIVGSSPTGASSISLSGLGSQARSTGDGGNITIDTERLLLTDGAQVTLTTFGNAKGGNLIVKAHSVELIGTTRPDSQGQNFPTGLLNGSQATTNNQSTGTPGTVTIFTQRFLAKDGGTVATSTFSRGKGGNLTLIASESAQLIGTSANGRLQSRLSARTTGVGDAGEVFIHTGSLTIKDRAIITVEGTGLGDAGNMTVVADNLILDNQGKITAATASGEGGNLNFTVSNLLLLRHQSLISAEAQKNGNGGNINLNGALIVGVDRENSDIVANAFQGRGGNINITTQGIYGLIFTNQLQPTRSEINASSQFGVSGNVQINTLTVDPSQGLANLLEQVVDATGLVEQSCAASGGEAKGKFVVTGRGGLPLSSNQVLSSDTVMTNWVTRESGVNNTFPLSASTPQPPISNSAPIVEAQGWITDADGKVILTAQTPVAKPLSSWLTAVKCGNS